MTHEARMGDIETKTVNFDSLRGKLAEQGRQADEILHAYEARSLSTWVSQDYGYILTKLHTQTVYLAETYRILLTEIERDIDELKSGT